MQPIQYVEGVNDKMWVKAVRKDLRRNSISVGTSIKYTREFRFTYTGTKSHY